MHNDSQEEHGLTNLYTLDEAAAVLNVSRSQVLTWIQQEALPTVPLGFGQQMMRIRQADLMMFAAESFRSQSTCTSCHTDTEGEE